MAVYEDTVSLTDGVSGPAKKAAQSVLALQEKMNGVLPATKSVGASMFSAANAMTVGKETIGAAAAGIKNAISSLAGGDVVGAFAGLTEGAASVAKALDLIAPGLGQVTAALISFAGGAVGAIAAGAKFAIECSEAKNASLALWTALGSGRVSGDEVDDMLDGLRGKLGVTKDAMAPFATEFLKMGITGKDALEGLTTAAISAEALVKGGGDAFTKLTRQINAAAESGQKLTIPYKKFSSQLSSMGLNIDDVAKKMNLTSKELTSGLKAGTIDAQKLGDAMQAAVTEKGAGPLEMMGLSVKNLGGMLKEYIGDMFEDLGPAIKPFLKEVKSLFGIFDSKTKPSGQALKEGIEGFFKRVFAIATKVVPMVKHFLLDMVIFGLKAYIGLKPIVKTLQQMWEQHGGLAKIQAVFEFMKPAIIGVAVVLGAVVAAAALLFAGLLALQVLIVAVVATIVGFSVQAGAALLSWAAGAAESAKNFIAGLIDGITAGAAGVVNAVKGLADKAKGAFKSALGIASPSKEMMKLGAFAGAGVSEGLDASAGDVKVSAQSLGDQAFAGAAGAGGGGGKSGGGGGGGTQITIEGIYIDGAGKAAQEITEEMVSLAFERIALAQGVG